MILTYDLLDGRDDLHALYGILFYFVENDILVSNNLMQFMICLVSYQNAMQNSRIAQKYLCLNINPNPHRVFSKHPAKCNRMHTAEMRTLLNATTCNSAFCCIVQGTHMH